MEHHNKKTNNILENRLNKINSAMHSGIPLTVVKVRFYMINLVTSYYQMLKSRYTYMISLETHYIVKAISTTNSRTSENLQRKIDK